MLSYFSLLGLTAPGEPAQKKRQKTNGRNYRIQVARPSVVEDYQRNMGYVDRHNRFRMDILGLARVWKTKKWQSRMIVEILGMALVDCFLLARKFVPAYMSMSDTDSTFWQFVKKLLPQIHPEREGSSSVEVDSRTLCTQVKLPTYKVARGKHVGRIMTQQQRCVYCVKNKRVGKDMRAIRTAWTCICHPSNYCCKKTECWIEHLADNECGHSDDNEANTASNAIGLGLGCTLTRASDGSSSDDDDARSSRSPSIRCQPITSVASDAPRLRSSDHQLDE